MTAHSHCQPPKLLHPMVPGAFQQRHSCRFITTLELRHIKISFAHLIVAGHQITLSDLERPSSAWDQPD